VPAQEEAQAHLALKVSHIAFSHCFSSDSGPANATDISISLRVLTSSASLV